MINTSFKPAKICYSHLGGKLGSLLLQAFVNKGWISRNNDLDKHYIITDKGEKEFAKLGIDTTQIKAEKL